MKKKEAQKKMLKKNLQLYSAGFQLINTGLPMMIWICEKSDSQNSPRMKIQTDHSNIVRVEKLVDITIEDEPKVIGGGLSQKDFSIIKKFIKLNQVVILQFWNHEISISKFIKKIQKDMSVKELLNVKFKQPGRHISVFRKGQKIYVRFNSSFYSGGHVKETTDVQVSSFNIIDEFKEKIFIETPNEGITEFSSGEVNNLSHDEMVRKYPNDWWLRFQNAEEIDKAMNSLTDRVYNNFITHLKDHTPKELALETERNNAIRLLMKNDIHLKEKILKETRWYYLMTDSERKKIDQELRFKDYLEPFFNAIKIDLQRSSEGKLMETYLKMKDNPIFDELKINWKTSRYVNGLEKKASALLKNKVNQKSTKKSLPNAKK